MVRGSSRVSSSCKGRVWFVLLRSQALMHSRSTPARENRALARRIMRQGMEMEAIVMVVV